MEKQKIAKSKIEDFINDLLDGETRENALDFVAWLRANKMGISCITSNANGNSWKLTYKGKIVCRILTMTKGSWYIENYDDRIGDIEELIIRENMQDVIWAHIIRPCHYCMPHNCAKVVGVSTENFNGYDREILGREFKDVCKRTGYFHNPDKRAVECMKKYAISKSRI